MSTQTDKIREAADHIIRAAKDLPDTWGPGAIIANAERILSELEAQPSAPTVDEVMDVVKQWGERYYYEGYLSDLRARLTKLLTNP